jgi:hypothetical protein
MDPNNTMARRLRLRHVSRRLQRSALVLKAPIRRGHVVLPEHRGQDACDRALAAALRPHNEECVLLQRVRGQSQAARERQNLRWRGPGREAVLAVVGADVAGAPGLLESQSEGGAPPSASALVSPAHLRLVSNIRPGQPTSCGRSALKALARLVGATPALGTSDGVRIPQIKNSTRHENVNTSPARQTLS